MRNRGQIERVDLAIGNSLAEAEAISDFDSKGIPDNEENAYAGLGAGLDPTRTDSSGDLDGDDR